MFWKDSKGLRSVPLSSKVGISVLLVVAGVVTVQYSDVQQYLVQDRGRPVSRLVSISHTHVLGTLPVIFLLACIFSFTLYAQWIRTVVIGFSSLAVAFAALILLSLYELWLKRT